MDLKTFDWDTRINIWEKWWNKELGRPIFKISTPTDIQKMAASESVKPFLGMYDFSIDAEDIVKKIKKQNEQECKHRDASYPNVWMNFGAGVLAAFVGGEGNCGEDTIWFEAGEFEGCDIKDISIIFNRQSKWFLRVEEFFKASAKHLGGEVHIGQTDIGGTLDVLSSLRSGEMLMFDMYDNPDEVKRLTWEIHEAWFEVFNYFNSLLSKSNHGYSSWAGMLSQKTHCILQCDFAYMISPDQFEEFVLPELASSCKRMERAFYHLDGAGQLGHLDHLLAIPELVGIQWVPGAGAPDCSNWPEMYRKIAAADRLMQVIVHGVDVIEKVLTQVDKPELIQFQGYINKGEEERLNKIYRKFGIEPI
ncbi:MAG: hypothetical protein KOO69_08885 [Victivallales bacterium]|nr:hypothetical protein [Victivallales bacterium]